MALQLAHEADFIHQLTELRVVGIETRVLIIDFLPVNLARFETCLLLVYLTTLSLAERYSNLSHEYVLKFRSINPTSTSALHGASSVLNRSPSFSSVQDEPSRSAGLDAKLMR